MIKLMTIAGIDNKYVVLLINESHFDKNFVLEDINSLINTGDIPNLWNTEDFLS